MAIITINGSRFLNGDAPVSRVLMTLLDGVGGNVAEGIITYVPEHPDVGNSSSDTQILSISNTEIVVEVNYRESLFVGDVTVEDIPVNYSVLYDVEPDAPLGEQVQEFVEVFYDPPNDRLTIAADNAIFPDVPGEDYYLHIDKDNGVSVVLGQRLDDYTMVLPNAWSVLTAPTTVTLVVVSRGASFPSRVQIVEWTGAVTVTTNTEPVEPQFTVVWDRNEGWEYGDPGPEGVLTITSDVAVFDGQIPANVELRALDENDDEKAQGVYPPDFTVSSALSIDANFSPTHLGIGVHTLVAVHIRNADGDSVYTWVGNVDLTP